MKKPLLAAVSAIALALIPATASSARTAGNTTEHTSFPAAGAVFTCAAPLGDLTATSGFVAQSIHTNVDGAGVFHITGTVVPHDVTLTDASGATYTLSGASWFGGKGSGTGVPTVSTDTEHFVIHSATGGLVARVALVEHLSPNGMTFSKNFGTCLPPAG
jgi:hypothetical protein